MYQFRFRRFFKQSKAKSGVITISQSILQSPKAYVPRFLVRSSTGEGKSIASLSPFLMKTTFQTFRFGQLLVECETEPHEKNLGRIIAFLNASCTVTWHESLNPSMGILRCPTLNGQSDKYILKKNEEQGVTAVHCTFYK